MKFEKSRKYDENFLKENMMGPNCIKLLEDLTQNITISKGMRVLDLGCGKGLTSIFLAKEFGATVYATDLWISATENFSRTVALGLEDQIIPIHADANDLPYADEYFDAMVSIDAYHYFGGGEACMDERIAPLIKPGGVIAVCVPGVFADLDAVPKELSPYISDEDFITFRSAKWWRALLEKSEKFSLDTIWEPDEFDEVWNDWLACDNEYAIRDRDFIRDNDGQYLNFVSFIGKRV